MTTLKSGENILKSRDDPAHSIFSVTADGKIDFSQGIKPAWVKSDDPIEPEKLRERIEPWLTSLFQSEHLSLLIGSGLTLAVGKLAECSELASMGKLSFEVFAEQINAAAEQTAQASGRKSANFEDQIRVANELLRGLQHYGLASKPGVTSLQKDVVNLEKAISAALYNLASSILETERKIITSHQRKNGFEYLVSFLMSPASRSGTRDRLQIFTTNYDRIIEAGAEAAGLHLIDRFVGNLAPIFRSSRLSIDMHYNPPGIRGEPRFLEGVARFTKLHGSVDWVYVDRDIRRMGLPLGSQDLNAFLNAPSMQGVIPLSLMVYPNSSKDRETAAYPYVDLFRDFAAALCRPNSTLITYGYSFGDEHINRVIEDMLTIPSTHLVIISYGDPMGRIMETYAKIGRHAQITLLIGSHLGDLKTLVDQYMPKPAIDKATFRMAELLKSRFGTQGVDDKKDNDDKGESEGKEK